MKDASEKREYYEFMNPVADEIRAFSYSGVGVGDTDTDEAICHPCRLAGRLRECPARHRYVRRVY